VKGCAGAGNIGNADLEIAMPKAFTIAMELNRRRANMRTFVGVRDTNDLVGTVRIIWKKAGSVQLDRKGKLNFDYCVDVPGVYRISVCELDDIKHEYIGETGDLKRRFSEYRNPKVDQEARLNKRFKQFLIGNAVIKVDLVDEAWIDLHGLDQELSLYDSNHRRLIEYFVLTTTSTKDVKRLNR
jgi:hypothetical protein